MKNQPREAAAAVDRRLSVIIAVVVAVVILSLTIAAVRQSQSDSYHLLVRQGVAFTEALAQASGHAIASEMFFDNLVQKRYSDLVASLTEMNLNRLDEQDLVRFAQAHDLFSVYVCDSSSRVLIGATPRGPSRAVPGFVMEEVTVLFADPGTSFILLTDQDDDEVEIAHYYLEMSSQLDRVVVLSCDALYYSEALRQTGIGYLAQSMAREQGVEYIIYQSTEGIIFASRKPGDLLAIESDPFLTHALEIDSIVSRQFDFRESTVLELVRPFSTRRFPFGLFRVGLSLEGYYAVSHGLIVQVTILAAILVCLILVIVLYLNSRRKRELLNREYTRIKSVTDKIFEQMRTGVATIDSSGKVRLANEAFERILGLSDVVGKDWTGVTPGDAMKLDNLLRTDDDTSETEITLTIRNKEKTVLVVCSKLLEEETNRVAVVIVIYDITRLKEYERSTARRERLSEMGDLAAGVAHEIRNPLNSISIAAQRLASEFVPRENDEEYQSFTGRIRDETRRLNEIITRFLALSREEKKKMTRIRLDKLIDEVTGLLEVEAARLNVTLTSKVSSGLNLIADPDLLKQVFRNLFNNAVESMQGETGSISIDAEAIGGQVRLVFADSGPGIPKEIRSKVFAPYFTTRQEGTGLGLSTVHKIITDIGGEVEITDSQWGGTGIVMTFSQSDSAS